MCACGANTGQAALFGGLGVAQRSLRFQRAHTSLAKEPQRRMSSVILLHCGHQSRSAASHHLSRTLVTDGHHRRTLFPHNHKHVASTRICLAGMIFVPPGYSLGADMFALDEVKGGSSWGASTFAGGDNSREVSEKERKYALHQVGTAGEAAGRGQGLCVVAVETGAKRPARQAS